MANALWGRVDFLKNYPEFLPSSHPVELPPKVLIQHFYTAAEGQQGRREWGRGRGSRLQGGKLHDKLIMHSAGLFAALAESLLSANSSSRSEGCVWSLSSPCRILRSVRRGNECLRGLAGGGAALSGFLASSTLEKII